jgi:hypothetical protein
MRHIILLLILEVFCAGSFTAHYSRLRVRIS